MAELEEILAWWPVSLAASLVLLGVSLVLLQRARAKKKLAANTTPAAALSRSVDGAPDLVWQADDLSDAHDHNCNLD